MAPRESQKRASLKWDKENMTVLSCKIRKEQAVAFKAHCEGQGSTSNTVLKDFVLGCIGEQEPGMPSGTPQEAPGWPAGAGTTSLSSDALKTAQEAAEAPVGAGSIILSPDVLGTAQAAAAATGEATAAFVARAVQTQAERDKAFLKMGIDPATGNKLKREA